jgi:phosphoribosylamine--glycine ligase
MASDGCPYSGILYVGLMIKDGKPRVVEYNARFGDPEAQPLLMRMKSDIVPVLQACARGNLRQDSIEWHNKAAVCVVMASGGYPASYEKGFEITGLDDVLAMDDVVVFHAGTNLKDGKIVNSGGRVLGVTGLGSTVAEAIECAYSAVDKINWSGVHFRKDIGRKALNR